MPGSPRDIFLPCGQDNKHEAFDLGGNSGRARVLKGEKWETNLPEEGARESTQESMNGEEGQEEKENLK